ncbi:MAG: hypothetical protein ACOX8R_00825 [Bacillota bacterium]
MFLKIAGGFAVLWFTDSDCGIKLWKSRLFPTKVVLVVSGSKERKMQNRYTGDIGDYGKLGLLRVLQFAGLTVGVNWYLTPDENHNGDGRHVDYLKKEEYRVCDESLWSELNNIVNSEQREVQALQNDSILNASFYSKPLVFSGKTKMERCSIRERWHKKALSELARMDIVFVDPDNGLIVPSAVGTVKENKYVLPDEIVDYYRQGSSVVYYQHKARKQDSFYMDQQNRLLKRTELNEAAGLALKFKKTSQRYYFFVMQPRHREVIERAVRGMIASAWGDHFEWR